MAENNLRFLTGRDKVVEQDHINQFASALTLDVVPRNSAGVPAAEAGELGTAVLPWATVNTKSLYVNGSEIKPPADAASGSNAILSGKTSAKSKQPKFLKADGSTNKAYVLADDVTPLELTINGSAVNYIDDVEVIALTLAPAANNTCLVNKTQLSGQSDTKYLMQIPIDTVGSAITALNGKIAAFKISTEIFIAYVDTTNGFLEVFQRGFFFDATNEPISRVAISNNDVITLLSLCYIFADGTGTQVNFSSGTITISGSEPAGAVINDYWFDTADNDWNYFTGAAWSGKDEEVDRLLIGYAVCDTTNCIATRCADFSVDFGNENTVSLIKLNVSQLRTERQENLINIYGYDFYFNKALKWDMVLHLDAGLTEANSTKYYFYLKDSGDPVISDIAPNYNAERRGGYHPFETWRFIASAVNDSGGDLGNPTNYKAGEVIGFTATGAVLNPHGLNYGLILIGGGGEGGGTGIVGNAGGATTGVWSAASAGGGAGGNTGGASNDGGAGGSASGGIIAKSGDAGTAGGVGTGLGGAPAAKIGYMDSFLAFAAQPAGFALAGVGPGNGGNSNAGGGGAGGGVYDIISNGLHGFVFIGAGGTGTTGGDGANGIAYVKFL